MSAGRTVVLGRGFPLELRLLSALLQRKRLARAVALGALLLHLGSLLHSLQGKYWVYSRASQLRNDVVIFINTVSDLLLVSVNVLGLLPLLGSPFLLELLRFCTAPLEVLGPSRACSPWINLLRFGPLLPIVTGGCLFSRNAGWASYQYFLGRQVWYYVMNLVVCAFICAALQLKWQFTRINDFLGRGGGASAAQLQLVAARFNGLCNLLDEFNRTFKALMVLVVMCVTGSVLHNCTSLIEYAAKPKGAAVKLATFLTQPLFALTTVGQAAVVAFVGEGLEEEGERTTRICFTLLNQLDHAQGKSEPLVARELRFILEHSRARKICLHAGGFFRLNWGILGSITSTVATYSIVIIQFLLK
ncbi:uncharacterized protein LOC109543498 isoform X2 [Dendroctonus ponderosae]|uniref:uncharacterized protein LOC109543498 isoform X2 n=1 Tax=Dendroctonus ponderosae TaxID=77166 RepID=UPI0020357CEC|nr:uncharacterized protein LOC109543498 isoform X2 [Dendroctonus ponderosae]